MRQLTDAGSRGLFHRSGDFLEANRRHLEPGWYEWTLRELVRHFYMLGILALIFMVPLQLMAWWMPARAPAVVDPIVVALVAIGFVLGVLYIGWGGYSYIWRVGGYVDRVLAEREVQSTRTPKPPLRP